MDYLKHLSRESARFAEVITDADPESRVPSCPDWTADDLLWHLAEVQWFWATVVGKGVTGERAEQLKPDRPRSRAELLSFYRRSSGELGRVLAASPPEAPAWTWSSDRTVGFVRRRQAHEALIHRVDAELAAGARTPLDAELSADGVDEALRVMYGGLPEWGAFTADPGTTVRLRATDTGDSWLVTLGRFTGTDPASGTSYDEPDIHPEPSDNGAAAQATITGRAADLDCWLWHRPPDLPVERSGDDGALSDFEAVIAPGIN